MFNTLKSQGIIVGKNALYQYLTYFEDAYVLFCIPIFTFSEKIRQANPKKIYAVDPGIITVYSVKKSYERAARLENAVFNKLRRESKDIFYYKTKSGKEVDFILMTAKGEYELFQVCLDMQEEKTKLRELSALQEAAKELDLQEAMIITEDQEEEIKENGIKIICIPFWKWALSKT
jgi:predicted AAA+ superfamily ATPase